MNLEQFIHNINWEVINAGAISGLKRLPDECVNTCVTSPPYFALRDYGVDGQIGLEETPEAYVARLVEVFREVRRVLRKDGTAWINIGDSYAGSSMTGGNNGINMSGGEDGFKMKRQFKKPKQRYADCKPKDLIGVPWMLAFALRADGWYLRSEIIWWKPNPMPESVKDRPTRAHEQIFLLSKYPSYYYDADAIREANTDIERDVRTIMRQQKNGHKNHNIGLHHGENEAGLIAGGVGDWKNELTEDQIRERLMRGANKRSVWKVAPTAFSGAHFAPYPKKLVEPCVLAGCPEEGLVLDPFTGSGTTAIAAITNRRNFIGTEINPEYVEIARKRVKDEGGLPMGKVLSGLKAAA